MCGSHASACDDGATHVKNIAAGRIEQIIDEAIGPMIYPQRWKIQRRSKFKLCKHNCNVQALEESYEYHHYLEEIREYEKTIDWLNEAVVRCHLYDEEILMGRRLMTSL